jgi:hypothetical protein
MRSGTPQPEPVIRPEIIDPPPDEDEPVIPEPDPTHTPVIPSPDPSRDDASRLKSASTR